jgi:LPXTG-motif cell wall-anchored protein
MLIVPALLIGTTMAIFGTLSYLKGSKWAFIALLILLLAFVAIKVASDQIVALLNGLYVGVMIMLKGGLGAIASGDVDALKEILSSIDKPFTGENEDYALVLFILGAVAFGLLLYLIMKKKKSTVFALILGLTYGYVLMAAVLPLVTNIPATSLPVPIIQPSGKSEQVAQQAQSGANQLLETLSSPQSIQILTFVIGAFIVLLLLLTVRKGVKNPAVKSPADKTPEKKG